MLSGALILPKAANQPVLKFYKKRILQFIVLLSLYSILTKLSEMLSYTNGLKESILISLKDFNGIYPNNIGGAHLWFMYAIIGLYLIAPFLGRLLNTLSNKEIIIFLTLGIFFYQFKFTLQGGFNIKPNILYSMEGDFLGAYLNFFILGYLLIYREIKINLLPSLILFILPITIGLYREIYKEEFLLIFHWYSTSFTIIISSIGILGIIRIFFEQKKLNTLVKDISKCSFGIYLSHYIFIFIFKRLINFSNMSFSIKLVVLFITSFSCAYLFTWILSKNRFTRFFVI